MNLENKVLMPVVSQKKADAMKEICSPEYTAIDNQRIKRMKNDNPLLYTTIESVLPENIKKGALKTIARIYFLLANTADESQNKLPLVSESTLEVMDKDMEKINIVKEWVSQTDKENTYLINFFVHEIKNLSKKDSIKIGSAVIYMYQALKKQYESNMLFTQYLSTP